jgi:hypothetical protein
MPSSNRTSFPTRHIAPHADGTRPDQQVSARVYLIANPISRKSAAWPKIIGDLHGRIKSATLTEFSDLFAGGADYAARWTQVIAGLAGAVVVPRPMGGRLMLGLVALREANEIDGAGKPVLIYTRQGLFRWAQADVRIHGRDRGHFRAELSIPGGAR